MLNSILYTILNIYVHVKLYFVECVSQLYQKYPKLVHIEKTIQYYMYSGYKWWYSIRSEPLNEKNWIYLSSIISYDQSPLQASLAPDLVVKRHSGKGAESLFTTNSSGDRRSPDEFAPYQSPRLNYHELYRNNDDFDENIHLVQYWYHHFNNIKIPLHVINCPLLMVKHNDKYLVRLCTYPSNKISYLSDIIQLTDCDNEDKWIPSKVKFLNISYTNPNMSNEILLEIPQNMFFVGNQLLSATFVLRMLEYTIGSTVLFDMNYKLKIMDSNIQYFEMDSNEYLELELDTYNKKSVV